MTKKSVKKNIPIQNKGSKEIRFSEPVTVYVGRDTEYVEVKNETFHSNAAPTKSTLNAHEIQSENSNLLSTNKQDIEPDKFQQDQQQSVSQFSSENESSNLVKEVQKDAKQKTPTVTMEQFILQAYARK